MFQHILVPTDGSSFNDKAMERAFGLAAQRGVDVLALHVLPRLAMNYYDGATAPLHDEIAGAEALSAGAVQHTLRSLAERAQASGVRLQTAIAISDSVSDAIVDTAARCGSDVIVMASRGRSGLARLLLGSRTDRVLRHSKVPVLLVR